MTTTTAGIGTRDWDSDAPIPAPARPTFWRTLEEHADDPAFQEHLYNEFPSQIEAITDPVARRTFLKLMGASLALAGVTACTRQPAGENRPVREAARRLIPGKPLFYATAMPLGGVAHRPARREPRGAADQDRGQPAAPGKPRRHRRLRAGGDPRPLRSGSLADADQPRRDPPVVGVPRRDQRGADRAEAAQRRRPPHPDRVGQLADARRADPRAARAFPVGEMASVGSGEPRQRARRREARLRRVRRRAVPLRAGRRHPLARRRFPRLRARARCATRANSPRAGVRRTPSA